VGVSSDLHESRVDEHARRRLVQKGGKAGKIKKGGAGREKVGRKKTVTKA